MTLAWPEIKALAEWVFVTILSMVLVTMVVASLVDSYRTGKVSWKLGSYDTRHEPMKCYAVVALRVISALALAAIDVWMTMTVFCGVLKRCS